MFVIITIIIIFVVNSIHHRLIVVIIILRLYVATSNLFRFSCSMTTARLVPKASSNVGAAIIVPMCTQPQCT